MDGSGTAAGTVVLGHASPAAMRELRTPLSFAAERVVEAGDRDAVIEACRRLEADAVVLHPSVAGGDVHGLAAELKRDPELFEVGVVVILETVDLDTALEGLTRGVHHCVREPVEPGELVAAVRSAIRTARLQRELLGRASELERLAYTDPLTKIPNRRFVLRQLDALRSGARRHGRPVSVAMIDIDHFKAVNDRFGHEAGDGVLIEVARRLQGRLRGEDVLGRYGGEEFLALLPDTAPEGAATVAEGMRRTVGEQELQVCGEPLRVTVSVGHATFDGEEPGERLVARADDALYAAKRAGRDRVRATA
jgi:two-component system cell cycle response regulator